MVYSAVIGIMQKLLMALIELLIQRWSLQRYGGDEKYTLEQSIDLGIEALSWCNLIIKLFMQHLPEKQLNIFSDHLHISDALRYFAFFPFSFHSTYYLKMVDFQSPSHCMMEHKAIWQHMYSLLLRLGE